MRNFTCVLLLLFVCSTLSFSQPTQTKEKLPCIDKTFSVVVHIVKDSLHQPGVTEASILTAIAGASTQFTEICVNFQVCEFRYIENYMYDDMNLDNDFPEMQHQYNLKNRINIYYVTSFSGGGSPCGFATLGGIKYVDEFGIVIKKSCAANAYVMAHEMGHYWGLYHTFEAVEHGKELADGSNCSTAGDLVCDTPADPYTGEPVSQWIDTDCKFTSMVKDANGDFYDPHTSNIMSYYNACPCSRFTDGQFLRMAYMYLGKTGMW